MPVWVQIDAYDPVAGGAVTLRASNMDDPAVCLVAGGTWWPMIAKAPVLRYDLFDGAFGGEISAPTTSFGLQVEVWPNFGRYAIADARVRVWTDIAAAPIFDGRATAQPKLANGQAEINIKVDDSWLDRPLLATYAGTTGMEGPAGLKGTPKPLALGAPRYVPGKLIDSVNNVFQVSAYGAVQGFEAALERLARFGASIGNYSTYAALVAATIPAGAWATCNAQGLVRFGAPTNGQVTFLLQGDAAGTDGWARKPGQLIRRLAILSGGAGKIHDASLNALDAARPYNLSLYLDQQATARQVIQSIAASVNAVAGVSWTGQLFVVPVAIGTASITLAADGTALPPVRSVEQMEVAAPFARIALTAERAWTVHQLADIAFADPLEDRGAYDPSAYYRPGAIVQYAGASWRYQSGAAPGSGNAPPTPPTASNAWWTVLAQQGGAGAAGANAKTLVVLSDRQTIAYDAAGAPDPTTQTTTFTTNKQNTAATVYWTLADATGTPVSVSYLSAASGDSVTMTEAAFAAARGSTSGVIVTASLTDGAAISDKISVTAVKAGSTGANGAPGTSTAQLTIYQRAASAPAVPSATATYTFAAKALAGLNNGWSVSIPAGSDPVYTSQAFASSTGATASIASGDWSAPVLAVQNGQDATTVRTTLAASDTIPGSGTTETTIATASITLPAGGQLKISGGLNNVVGQGSQISIATLRLKVAGSTIATGSVSIDADGALISDGVAAWAGQLFSNPASGPVTISVTRQRSGPAISGGASYALNLIVEHVN